MARSELTETDCPINSNVSSHTLAASLLQRTVPLREGSMEFLLSCSRRGARAAALAFGVLAAAGCADHPLESRTSAGGASHVYTLPAVEATACRYGGEYPFCAPPPNPDGGMDPGTEPITPEGGGDSGTTGTIPLTEDDCPAADPNCKVPLDDADKQSLARATALINRNAHPVCAQLADQLVALGTARVYRGSYDSSGHTGEADHGDIHVDRRIWDGANTEGGGWDGALAEALLHEVAHLLYPPHVGETQSPYSTFPYNHMHSSGSGVPQCVP